MTGRRAPVPSTQEGLAGLVQRTGVSSRVVEAFRRVDRAKFVPSEARGHAYEDAPVAIPGAQVTSQPTLIAVMLDAAGIRPGDRVLEVGAGYGFQTALIAELAGGVVSVERSADLARTARLNLDEAGIVGARVFVGDGFEGRAMDAPFDAVVVSAAAAEVPAALMRQLDEGGRLLLPLAARRSDDVWLFRKRRGELERVRLVVPAHFVPLVRGVSD